MADDDDNIGIYSHPARGHRKSARHIRRARAVFLAVILMAAVYFLAGEL